MTKKKLYRILAIICFSIGTIGLIISLYCFGTIIYVKYFRDFEIGLTPAGCQSLFGVSPEEFFDAELEFYDETGDFRPKSRIDEYGNLILVLSPKQRKKWRESEWLSGFPEVVNDSKFEISSDLCTLTYYFPTEYLEDEEFQPLAQKMYLIQDKMTIIHFLDGKDHSEISIQCIEKDPITGEVLNSFTCTPTDSPQYRSKFN